MAHLGVQGCYLGLQCRPSAGKNIFALGHLVNLLCEPLRLRHHPAGGGWWRSLSSRCALNTLAPSGRLVQRPRSNAWNPIPCLGPCTPQPCRRGQAWEVPWTADAFLIAGCMLCLKGFNALRCISREHIQCFNHRCGPIHEPQRMGSLPMRTDLWLVQHEQSRHTERKIPRIAAYSRAFRTVH